jgi:hypothetical protein
MTPTEFYLTIISKRKPVEPITEENLKDWKLWDLWKYFDEFEKQEREQEPYSMTTFEIPNNELEDLFSTDK